MDSRGSLQPYNLLLGVPQPQSNRLVGTLASLILQRIPRTKNTRSGLPQTKVQESNRQLIKTNRDKGSQQSSSHSKVAHYKQSSTTILLPSSFTLGGRNLGIHSLLQQKSQFISTLEQLRCVIREGVNH